MSNSVPAVLSQKIFNFLWPFRKPSFVKWAVLGGFVVLWYLIILWGYHSDRLPYQFDNFVQSTGIWHVLGAKEYKIDPVEKYALDPRLDLVDTVYHSVKGSGYVIEPGSMMNALMIDILDTGPVVWTLDADVHFFVKNGTETDPCQLCTIEALLEGEYVTIIKEGIVNVETGEIETKSIQIIKGAY